MSVYTLSSDFLKNAVLKSDFLCVTEVLMTFVQRSNTLKVAVDKGNKVIDLYNVIAGENNDIKHWLDLMSYTPQPFERIDVEFGSINCEETIFLKLCKETKNQKKMIIFSYQNLCKYTCTNGKLLFEGAEITLLDKEFAQKELRCVIEGTQTYNIVNIFNSQLANEGSTISNSKNTSNN